MSTRIRAAVATWGQEWRDLFTERAGIMEFDGGLSRALAEQQAYLQLAPRAQTREDG